MSYHYYENDIDLADPLNVLGIPQNFVVHTLGTTA